MSRRLTSCCAALIVAAAACTEQASTASPVVQRVQPARLVLTDSSAAVGASVDVFADAVLPANGVVGSFTARIRFDSTSLRFDGELPLDDGAMRASNASPGMLRVAGAAQAGFANGRLAAYRFVVLRANGARTLALTMDELHTVERAAVQP